MSRMSLGSSVAVDAAHPWTSMSLSYRGGHGGTSGVRLIRGPTGVVATRGLGMEEALLGAVGSLGPSGVVAARGFEIETALVGPVGPAVGPAFGVTPRYMGPGPLHLGVSGMPALGVRTGEALAWER